MALLFIINFIFLSRYNKNYNLNIIDYKSHKIYTTIKLNKNDTFSISFIHSVNKTPVTDFYKFDDKKNIYIYKTNYMSFGAGMPTELNENENILYNDDGTMTIEHIDKKIDELTYYLSNIYDHTLSINETTKFSLWELCGKNKLIQITIT